jgi:primosomal protein N' (replication factor Y)
MRAPFATSEKKPPTKLVLLPVSVGDGFDYLLPEGMAVEDGAYVQVPFGRTMTCGVVWGDGTGLVAASKLKPLGQVLPLPSLPASLRRMIDWMSTYTLTPRGLVLKMAFGGRLRLPKGKDAFAVPPPDPDACVPALSEAQAAAAHTLIAGFDAPRLRPTLIDGVTGSGKTEVYAEAIAEALRRGQQALLLLPEIAMTAGLIERLARRFGAPPVAWHSELSEKERRLAWNAVTTGHARFVVGARSALFLPFPDLGLIVVDEEHEAAFKQEEGVIYHARDMAVVRGHLAHAPVVLASATPSLETLLNVREEKYARVALPERFGGAALPDVTLVDLRKEKLATQAFLSDPLIKALEATLATGQQGMLFLNRRGYAPLTLCRACGHRLQCPTCTSWLVEHKKTGRLHCHHCNYSVRIPTACPACGVEGKLAACGPGVERILEEVKARLPNARVALMASDTLSGPEAARQLIAQMEDRQLDLLIGTQIMAKGFHFPRLTFVGVVDADLGLGGGDPRAAERTFQLLQQVAGRSGRGRDAGHVLLQTVNPEHPVMKALAKGDRDAFYRAELREREAYRLPPFTRLASLIVSGRNKAEVIAAANKLAAAAPHDPATQLLGPAPAPLALLRGQTRYRLLYQAPKRTPLSSQVDAWLKSVALPRSIRVQVDIDPYSFM